MFYNSICNLNNNKWVSQNSWIFEKVLLFNILGSFVKVCHTKLSAALHAFMCMFQGTAVPRHHFDHLFINFINKSWGVSTGTDAGNGTNFVSSEL